MSRPHRTVLFAPLLAPLLGLVLVACAEAPSSPRPRDRADTGAQPDADPGDSGGEGEVGGCPSGALARLVWADRDLTHALMPGFALAVAPEVAAVVETQATLEIRQRFDQGRFTSVTLTALEGDDRRPLFEDRLLWGDDGLPAGEERWLSDGAEGWVLEAASTFRHDAEGRRLEATLEFAAGGRSQRLLWTWEEGCLVAYDRAADDGRPGSLLSCTTGDRVQELVADDGSPPRRFRWPADPTAAPGPDGLDEDEGAGFIFAEEWTWDDQGGLRSIRRADGTEQRLDTDAAGSLSAAVTVLPDGSEASAATFAITCD